MESEGDPYRQVDGGQRSAQEILSVKNHHFRRIPFGVVAIAHDPAIIFVRVRAAGDEDRLLLLL